MKTQSRFKNNNRLLPITIESVCSPVRSPDHELVIVLPVCVRLVGVQVARYRVAEKKTF